MENEREVLVEVNHLNVTYGSGGQFSADDCGERW